MVGEQAELHCEVDSHPAAEVSWVREGREVGRGPTLPLLLSNPTALQLYTCRVAMPGFSPLEVAVRVQVLGPPQRVQLQQPARLHCAVTAHPLPRPIVWTLNGNLI